MSLITPLALPGQRIALYGGSFDPPHRAHLANSLIALKALGVDQVWWLVSPQNPLKTSAPADLDTRLAAARAMARHPRLFVTDLERQLGTAYTADTLARLRARRPGLRFIWMMGADNLAQIHRWKNAWRIFDSVPVAVLDRPGFGLRALASPAARRYARARLDERDARRLAYMPAPAWVFLHRPLLPHASSDIRKTQPRLKQEASSRCGE